MTTTNALRSAPKPFDPTKPDCFSRYLNLSDAEVTALLAGIRKDLSGGEYDQGMTAYLPWDDAKDLLTIAEMLWSQRGSVVADTNQEQQ